MALSRKPKFVLQQIHKRFYSDDAQKPKEKPPPSSDKDNKEQNKEQKDSKEESEGGKRKSGDEFFQGFRRPASGGRNARVEPPPLPSGSRASCSALL